MTVNYRFNFKKTSFSLLELHFLEHIYELCHRTLLIFGVIFLTIAFTFLKSKVLIGLLLYPIENIKLFQISPDDYFTFSFKICFYISSFFASPFILSQFFLFLLPGLVENEIFPIFILLVCSYILFILGLIFSYSILIPITIKFFLNYSEEILEPFWSFQHYFNIISFLFGLSGFIFQIPIFQIILNLVGIASPQTLLTIWRYMFLISTIIGAILTPSTDPFTQMLFSTVIFLLYFLGSGLMYLILKNFLILFKPCILL